MNRDWFFEIIRYAGMLGLILIGIECLRITYAIGNERLKRVVWKITVFFISYGFLRMVAFFVDIYLFINWGSFFSSVANNVTIYWLYFYARKQRKRLQGQDFTTESKTKLSTSINYIMDDMKLASKEISNVLNS